MGKVIKIRGSVYKWIEAAIYVFVYDCVEAFIASFFDKRFEVSLWQKTSKKN